MNESETSVSPKWRQPQVIGISAAVLVVVVVVVCLVWWSTSRSAQVVPAAGGSPSSQTNSSVPPSPSAKPSQSPSGSSVRSRTPKPSASSQPSSTATENTLPELPPVGLDSEAEQPDAVVVRLSKIESVQGEARLPGEVAGPALRISVMITNNSDKAIDLGTVVVNGYRGDKRVPLESLTSPGGAPFQGELKPKNAATGVYVFAIDPKFRADVTFTVDATPGVPAAVFRGDSR